MKEEDLRHAGKRRIKFSSTLKQILIWAKNNPVREESNLAVLSNSDAIVQKVV